MPIILHKTKEFLKNSTN